MQVENSSLVVLLGASSWPEVQVFTSSNAFSNSVNKVKEYFLRYLKVPETNLLNLFDSDKEASEIDTEIRLFLNEGLIRMNEAQTPLTDIFIYYVGHGGFTEDRDRNFLLPIRKTTDFNLGSSSILMKNLAHTIKHSARHVRKIIILDCCFSAAAYGDFQSAAEQTAKSQCIEEFKTGEISMALKDFPLKGTSLFCSSGHSRPSIIDEAGGITMFTNGLVLALTQGSCGYPEELSLRTISDLTEKCLIDLYNNMAPRPEIHSPDQIQGDIAKIPIFPNYAVLRSSATSISSPSIPPTTILHSGDLPITSTPIIGRQSEVSRIINSIRNDESRIITLTGCNGIGKTRLSIEVAHHLAKSGYYKVRFVPLALISDPDQVATEIAPAVGFPEIKSPQHLFSYLKDKQYLLVLDNFEHVLEASQFISDLTKNCRGLKFLITSENRLNIRHEQVIEVLPLSVPEAKDLACGPEKLLSRFSSVQLLTRQAELANSAFRLTDENAREVAEICMRTKGLPLAIKAVAAHMKKLPISKMLHEIKRSGFLGQANRRIDILELYKTIQDTNGWSYARLPEEGKVFFRFLSVFDGGCTISMARSLSREVEKVGMSLTINVEDGINLLVTRGLLKIESQSHFDGQFRYRMVRTIRQYAQDRLKINGELYEVKEQHAIYFTRIAEEAEFKLTSKERESGRWLDRLNLEYGNIRAVLSWCLENDDHCEIGLRLAGALFWYWNLKGELREGRKWLELLSEKKQSGVKKEYIARALYAWGGLAFLQSDYDFAKVKLDHSRAIWEELDSAAYSEARRRLSYTLIILGVVELNRTNLVEAEKHLISSKELLEDRNDEWGTALVCTDLGRVFLAGGDLAKAEDYFNKGYALWKKMGDNWGEPLVLNCLGILYCKQELYAEALKSLNSAYKIQSKTDKWGRASILKDMGLVYFQLGKQQGSPVTVSDSYLNSVKKYLLSLEWHFEIGRMQLIGECLEGLGKLAIEMDEPEKGSFLFGAAEKIRADANCPLLQQEKVEYEEYVSRLINSLGTKSYQATRKRGYKESLDEIVKNTVEYAKNWIANLLL